MNLFTAFNKLSKDPESGETLVPNPIERFERYKKYYKPLSTIIAIGGIFLVLNLLFPKAISIILNIVWIVILTLVVIFFTLGVLVILGLRKEASRILDVLLEGSLTFIDILEFIKLVYWRFIDVLKDFILYVMPILGYVATALLYVLLLILYKQVGKSYDVTILTILLTYFLVSLAGALTKPRVVEERVSKWIVMVREKFKTAFTDGFEVILFVFFLTMDNENLFFLPEELNVPLRAKLFRYDLMVQSFRLNENLKFTLSLVMLSISIEILRNIMRIVATAKHFYSQELVSLTSRTFSKPALIKKSLRQSFIVHKPNLVRFITFSTVLFGAFMAFPRLKLLTLVVASITNLILDLSNQARLTGQRSTDLISRVLTKLFKV